MARGPRRGAREARAPSGAGRAASDARRRHPPCTRRYASGRTGWCAGQRARAGSRSAATRSGRS
ncbi:MAG: hypothetical protein DI556_20795 [Rhodovulum sulfidophilum]|uniref:Uncharacterized protein n=1 Tax=Rhodovulum sulfidophilum TaxID=35806 RepID=A0A2W5MYI7_RHOSU|nr:MAG: hypothetical protein DI556_20795 [Rhodovulum sulfidophilum]